MTLGDIIEKFLGLFGVAPGPQRRLLKKISSISTKIAEMEESRNNILRTNTAISEKIADLKRQLQVESSPHNQDLLMDRVDEAEKELERKVQLSRQMGENITAQRAIRARCEQLLEQLRHGADPAEIEVLIERVEDMNDARSEAGDKVKALDGVGKKSRAGKSAKDEDAARAARRAAMLGTVSAAPAPTPSAPATDEEAARAARKAAMLGTPSPVEAKSPATPVGEGTVAVG